MLAAVDRFVTDELYLLEGIAAAISLIAMDGLEHERCRLAVRERCEVAGHGECLCCAQCAEQAVPYSHMRVVQRCEDVLEYGLFAAGVP